MTLPSFSKSRSVGKKKHKRQHQRDLMCNMYFYEAQQQKGGEEDPYT